MFARWCVDRHSAGRAACADTIFMSSNRSDTDAFDALGTPRFLRPFERFMHIEASSGIVLMLAVAVALVWANWPGSHSYHDIWHMPLSIQFGEWRFTQTLHFFINDILMTIFFLVVGLEIRREIHEGALANLKLATLPLIAALGGVMAPALIYVSLNDEPALRQGWAVPTATDIAFAVGILTLLGKRVPAQLRILLLAIAIIDDIAAILVIAFFYSSGVKIAGLLVAAAGVGLVRLYNYHGIRTAWPYVVPGAVVWIGVLMAGVHPTIAGVALGLLTPVQTPMDRQTLFDGAVNMFGKVRERFTGASADLHEAVGSLQRLKSMQRELVPPVVRVQIALHPWVAFGIMPIFALANAGVVFDQAALQAITQSTVSLGVILGLVLGKPFGIALASVIAVRTGIAALPPGVTNKGLIVVGCLGGIGFTMSIFLAQLAYADAATLATAKMAVLIASTIAAILGLALGSRLLKDTSATA
ncbi:MAG TPA: Na+/H+ antiporter NhaA [Roseiflexaceae bacterium]|nr:Na+/H+ antiporter NhaA [Roseiflexaceae bacterium]